ncbi:MAG: hypothetical protein IPL25_03800 [Saprospiraceae bacterium]|nr:hypothetical protein [Candidatus Vicinibacter affinis]
MDFIHTFSCADTGYSIMLKAQISFEDNFVPTEYKYVIDGTATTSIDGIANIPISIGSHEVCLEVTLNNNVVCSKCILIVTPLKLGAPKIEVNDTLCENTVIRFDIEDEDFTDDIVDYVWVFNNTDTSRIRRPERTFGGNRYNRIELYVTNKWGCMTSVIDSFFTLVNNLSGDVSIDTMPCASLRHLTFSKTSGREPLTYKWNTNETSPDIIVNKSGDYIITVADPYGCTIEKSKMIELSESFFENLEGPNKVCANDINPMYSFLGNSSLYDYTLTEKKLPNGPENTSTLNSNNDVYSFIVNISNKSGTYQLIVRSRNKNSQTVCDSLLLELEVNGIEKPEIVDSFYSCRPFQYILREDNGNQIDWYNLVNGELYKIQNGNIISVNSGGLYVGIYNDVNGCTAQDTINLLEQNDLRTFISGCYDVCDTIIAKGNVFVPGLDGNRIYKSWKYVHIDSNNIIKQGSDSKVDSFLLLKNMKGKFTWLWKIIMAVLIHQIFSVYRFQNAYKR